MAIPRDVTDASQIENLKANGLVRPGDYVVGEYSDSGTRNKEGTLIGSNESNRLLTEMIKEHATRGGATIIEPPATPNKEANKSKGKKGKTPAPLPPAVAPTHSEAIEIVLLTQLGKIKLNVLSVLDTSNALLLVFNNEQEIRYEPAPGARVQLSIGGKMINAMYPGFKFTWVDQQKQLLVFVKIPEE